ncbi:cupin domain-containing protein [Skermanella sp. TT6]|uniref:Cupin domain-containing protein n=1 Tax=Skermanella cutis TaxID=2775420 RepID=A0ABX7B9W6_9PROT|nr:cupin domain-containing protein [Skermanella sp. TT6]QQP90405.1 cupin domain-containing protein [Skermanella sp. TT6]
MSKRVSDLAVIGETPSEEYVIRPDEERILAGSPDQVAWNHFTDATGQFSAGVWEGAPGVWRVNFTENEFCHLLSGVVVVRDEAGGERTFKAGDAFVMPAGFVGTWEVVERARKLYATFEAVT